MRKSISSTIALNRRNTSIISATRPRRTPPRHFLPPPPTRTLMSIPQVLFDPTRPYITIPSPNPHSTGSLHRNIRASFPKNAHKVVDELNALFASQTSQGGATEIWTLDSTCDAISRFMQLSSREHVVSTANQILEAAEQLNHHPSVSAGEGTGGAWIVIATCATHRPAGLSVKDARLARRIDEIAAKYAAEADGDIVGENVSDALRMWHWRENIGRALPSLDVAEEDSLADGEEDSGGTAQGRPGFWQLNSQEDIEAFLKHRKPATSSDMPMMRGLML